MTIIPCEVFPASLQRPCKNAAPPSSSSISERVKAYLGVQEREIVRNSMQSIDTYKKKNTGYVYIYLLLSRNEKPIRSYARDWSVSFKNTH